MLCRLFERCFIQSCLRLLIPTCTQLRPNLQFWLYSTPLQLADYSYREFRSNENPIGCPPMYTISSSAISRLRWSLTARDQGSSHGLKVSFNAPYFLQLFARFILTPCSYDSPFSRIAHVPCIVSHTGVRRTTSKYVLDNSSAWWSNIYNLQWWVRYIRVESMGLTIIHFLYMKQYSK